MLATNNPSNVQLQQSLKQLAGMVHWNYSQVSYDPANPATFGAAVDTALTKHANYIAEAGIPLTPALIKKVQDGGAKWVLTAVSPADVKPPIIVNANAYASDANMGKIMGDFFVSDSQGKGQAVIEHVPAYPILDGFTNGFNAEVKALCPDCTIKIIEHHDPRPRRRQGAEPAGFGAALQLGRQLPGVRRSAPSPPASAPRSRPPASERRRSSVRQRTRPRSLN